VTVDEEQSGSLVRPTVPAPADMIVVLEHLADEIEAAHGLLYELAESQGMLGGESVDTILGLRLAAAYVRELVALLRHGAALTVEQLGRICDLLDDVVKSLHRASGGVWALGFLSSKAFAPVLLAHLEAIFGLLAALGLTCWLADRGVDLLEELLRALEHPNQRLRSRARHWKF
jgi:hypothetical protein